MSVYGLDGLAVLALEAGFSVSDAPTAIALAMSESRGNSNATGSAGDCGLWQIHPPQPNCKDPKANARMAKVKFDTQGWNAWTDYKNGRYRQWLPNAEQAVARAAKGQANPGALDPSGTAVGNVASGASDIGGSIADSIRYFGQLLSSGALRTGFVVGGIILALIGLAIVALRSKTAKTVTKGVSDVVGVVK